ncbi:MAG: NIPSNAP family protein [Verrucomicrobiae bacterium]|nr:NIPSNAP family protein [Verrucomicrobiae bacterium]
MITRLLAVAALLVGMGLWTRPAVAADTRCYELRIYHAAPGKLDALHERFRNHTLRLFEKHGMRNIGYWVPVQNQENPRLYFILSYPNREAREASWKAFVADPDWQAAYQASHAGGVLVEKAESYFLATTDYSPAIRARVGEERRVFEFRDYTASAGNLDRLHARFRDHTVRLFSKHGMHHFGYWTPMPGEAGAEDRLVYLLWHDSTDAAKASFGGFVQDPQWRAARESSERAAGGSLTAPGGVRSLFLVATDYSPTR